MKALGTIALILVLVGAINWGLVGLFDYNLVSALLGTGMAAKVVYTLVWVAGARHLVEHVNKK
jgi:uncharacterized protein